MTKKILYLRHWKAFISFFFIFLPISCMYYHTHNILPRVNKKISILDPVLTWLHVLQYHIQYHYVSTPTSNKLMSILIDIQFVFIYISFVIQISCIWICISRIFYLILSHGFVFPSSRLHLWLLGIYWIIYYS